TVEQVEDPQPGPGEVLVRVHRCGICGSDVSMSSGGPMSLPLGRFGHEWAGEVVEVGRDVAGVKPGSRVAGLPVLRCGSCAECRDDHALFCERPSFQVGGFGEYMAIPARAAIALPQSLSFADGALVEPLSCGLHSLTLAGLRRGDRLLVLGA